MFVRWHTQKKRRHVDLLGDLEVCRLVESWRDKDGRPRHVMVAYLGSIRSAMPTNHKIAFWMRVNEVLDGLYDDKQLSTKARELIIAKIAERVPYVPPEDWQL